MSICYLQQSAAHNPDFLLFANHPIRARFEAPPPYRPLTADCSTLQPVVMTQSQSRPPSPRRPLQTPQLSSNVLPPVLLLLLHSCACLLSLPPSDTNTSRRRWPQPSLASPLRTSDLAVCRLDLSLSTRPPPNTNSQTLFSS